MDQNPLLGYKVGYKKNQCLVCFKDSGAQLFCADHNPLLQPGIYVRVSELKAGQIGYVNCKDMFAVGNALYIYNDAIVTTTSEGTYKVKISKSGNNLMISVENLEQDHFGVLNQDWAYTEVIPVGTLPELRSAISKKAADLQTGEECYIEPRHIFFDIGDLYVNPSADTASTMNIKQSVRIIRYEGGLKIDYTTLKDNDPIYPIPDRQYRQKYIPAILF